MIATCSLDQEPQLFCLPAILSKSDLSLRSKDNQSMRFAMDKFGKVSLPKKLNFSDVFFVITCLFLFAYIASSLTETGLRFFIVQSSSMRPVTRAGDVAIVAAINDKTRIQKGDVIAFRASGTQKKTIIHRVIDEGPNGFITKGDANERADANPVTAQRVIGIYRFNIPLIGFFFEGLRRVVYWLIGKITLRVGFSMLMPVFLLNNRRF